MLHDRLCHRTFICSMEAATTSRPVYVLAARSDARQLRRLDLPFLLFGDLDLLRLCAKTLAPALGALVPLQVACVVLLDQACHMLISLLSDLCTPNGFQPVIWVMKKRLALRCKPLCFRKLC